MEGLKGTEILGEMTDVSGVNYGADSKQSVRGAEGELQYVDPQAKPA